MLALKKLRNLELSHPISPGRPSYITAASGLVILDQKIFLVADDEHFLATFSVNASIPGHLKRLFEGELPLEHRERKKAKPDLEALTLLPRDVFGSSDALLALPSGSKKRRSAGCLIPIDRGDETALSVERIDLSLLYERLRNEFEDLNIEGAVCLQDRLRLFQRGNSELRQNAAIDLNSDKTIQGLKTSRSIPPEALEQIVHYDLGELGGVHLSFTDACRVENDACAFLAAAEGTKNTYDDGKFLGSILGIMDRDGKILQRWTLEIQSKPEGIWFIENSIQNDFMIVTDADDVTQPSELFCGRLPIGSF